MSGHYLAERTYFRLARRLLDCRDIEAVKQILGEVGDIWPDSVRRDLEQSDKAAASAKAHLARQETPQSSPSIQ